ncbi:MAG: sigma-70 family RNA polymerase sigma factor [Bacteroides sp.]|jgi:RNA polymerase sigma-70 factor (ECF subfamily)|nr:sigma-70 family RNA polymerase sigma factor [Bacteroides sp.]MCI1682173.1 sigma-70 family RNA polymerase sigma factor [Bacteroides sp.]
MELKLFKINVLPLRSKLLNYAKKYSDNPNDAEDAVQEVMLKLWERRDDLEQYRNIEAYAVTMIHNLCTDMWRSKYTLNLPLKDIEETDGSKIPERFVEIHDEMHLMQEIINSLPTVQRTIMRMKDIEGYETDEITKITGCSSEAIRSNLSRARKKVRDIYIQAIQEKKRRK